jgi:hypothetical protein
MPDQPSLNVESVFSAYVRLRQCGYPVAQAAQELRSSVSVLGQQELNELALMTQKWEANNTRKALPTTQPLHRKMVNAGSIRDAAPSSKSNIRPIQRKAENKMDEDTAIMPSDTFVIRPITVKNPTNYELSPCPQCSKMNRVGESYCYACGEVLTGKRTTTRRLEDTVGTRRKLGAAYFGAETSLVMSIRNTGDSIEIIPGDQEIVLGRKTENTVIAPDIDLTMFGAESLGVSRLHVSLKRTDRTITIMDMNSSNKTYINGQLLHPQEVRVLNDNDEVRLGRMFIMISFKHAS